MPLSSFNLLGQVDYASNFLTSLPLDLLDILLWEFLPVPHNVDFSATLRVGL
jgi:hypothetical protein